MSRITCVSPSCCGLGLLFVNDDMELEIEEINSKSYKRNYTIYKRMLKRFQIYNTLFNCVPAFWSETVVSLIG